MKTNKHFSSPLVDMVCCYRPAGSRRGSSGSGRSQQQMSNLQFVLSNCMALSVITILTDLSLGLMLLYVAHAISQGARPPEKSLTVEYDNHTDICQRHVALAERALRNLHTTYLESALSHAHGKGRARDGANKIRYIFSLYSLPLPVHGVVYGGELLRAFREDTRHFTGKSQKKSGSQSQSESQREGSEEEMRMDRTITLETGMKYEALRISVMWAIWFTELALAAWSVRRLRADRSAACLICLGVCLSALGVLLYLAQIMNLKRLCGEQGETSKQLDALPPSSDRVCGCDEVAEAMRRADDAARSVVRGKNYWSMRVQAEHPSSPYPSPHNGESHRQMARFLAAELDDFAYTVAARGHWRGYISDEGSGRGRRRGAGGWGGRGSDPETTADSKKPIMPYVCKHEMLVTLLLGVECACAALQTILWCAVAYLCCGRSGSAPSAGSRRPPQTMRSSHTL